MSEPINIPQSKSKMALLFFGSLLFIGLGVWFLIHPPRSTVLLFTPGMVRFVGAVGLLFFGIIGIGWFRKLNDKKPGLSVSEEGITDHSGGLSIGLIPWNDIVAIEEIEIANQKSMNIIVKDPQHYLLKQKTSWKRRLMQINQNSYGSCVSISANGLKCAHKELRELLENSFEKYNRTEVPQ